MRSRSPGHVHVLGLVVAFCVATLLASCSNLLGITPLQEVHEAPNITSFMFTKAHNRGLSADVTTTIDGGSITAMVPVGTDVTRLVATFQTTGVVTVGGITQTSENNANDFTNPVTYLAGETGSTRSYVVTVTFAASGTKDLTLFEFRSSQNTALSTDVTATISGTSITATVPFGTDLTGLIATFQTTGATVRVGSIAQVTGATTNDFTNPVTYTVTAADHTTQSYSVTVARASSSAKDITTFAFLAANNPGLSANMTANINGTEITAAVPFGTAVTALVATFQTIGANVNVGAVNQTSSATANNFTNPLMYTVVAADASTKIYTVTITVAGPSSVSFASHVDFATGTSPDAVASADLNGDGRPDVIVANNGSNTVSVLLDTTVAGSTTPTLSAKVDFGTGSTPAAVAIGDFNADGRADIAVANLGSDTVSVLLNTTSPGASAASFSTRVDFTTGVNPQFVAIADLNGDGKLDLAVANRSSNTVSVLLGTTPAGATIPSFAVKTDVPTGTVPYGVAIGDLNGDGKPDLVVANFTANTVSVCLNTTTPGSSPPIFATKVDFATGANPDAIVLGDLNGDGRPDVAVANNSSNTVSVLLDSTSPGASAPTLAARVDFPTGGAPESIAIADFNGDGKPDLAIANQSSSSSSVLQNLTVPGASPSFAARFDVNAGTGSVSVAAQDLNGDGKADLIVANFNSNTVSVSLNATPWGRLLGFATATNFATGNDAHFIAVHDLNGDGRPDMVIVNAAASTLSVLFDTTAPGAGTATFGTKVDIATGVSPRGVSIGDFNGDGLPDLAIVNTTSSTLSVFLNTTSPGAATASFAARVDFPTGAAPISVAMGDFNGDGRPDIAVANVNAATVSIFLDTMAPGATVATLAAKVDFATGMSPVGVVLDDFNGDGELDLAVANNGSNTVSVLLGTTAPGASIASFAPKVDVATGMGPWGLATGDLNGDGQPDISVTDNGMATVSVLLDTTALGGALPTFATRLDLPVGAGAYAVAIADLNGDGKADLTVANSGTNTVSVLLGTTPAGATTASFAGKVDFTTGMTAVSVAVEDFNGDGKPDLAVVNGEPTSNVSVLLGQ